MLPEFAQAYFQHRLYTGQFAAMCVQTTSMAHLTAVRFSVMPIPIPPRQEQEMVATILDTLQNEPFNTSYLTVNGKLIKN